jgi:hypothetical protein
MADQAYAIVIRLEDIYGSQASKEIVGVILGNDTQETIDQEGHVSAGRCDIPVANVRSPEDLRRTLRHKLE